MQSHVIMGRPETPEGDQKVRLSSKSTCNPILYRRQRVSKDCDSLKGPTELREMFRDPVRISIERVSNQKLVANGDYLCCRRLLHLFVPLGSGTNVSPMIEQPLVRRRERGSHPSQTR